MKDFMMFRQLLSLMMRIFGFGAAFFLFISSSLAATVSLEIQTHIVVEQDSLHVLMSLTNRGDEPAYHIQIVAEGPNIAWSSMLYDILPVNETHKVDFHKPLTDIPPGRHALIVRVLYTDANGYPFSALSVSQFVNGENAIPQVGGVLDHAELRDQGHIKLRIKNLSSKEQSIMIRLILPQEISTSKPLVHKTLMVNQPAAVIFPLRNFSALAGSTYSVYAIIEHTEPNFHHSMVATGTIRIVSSNMWQQYQVGFLVLGIFLLAVIVIINIAHVRTR